MTKVPVKISVGMPVYNGEQYLEEAIRATLEQTYGDFELIISDNFSTDRTETICRDFSITDSRIKYKRNEKNIGAAANYNQLFHMAEGKYFRWFNADDLCSKYLHEKCLEVMESSPDVVMCYGKTDIIGDHGQFLRHYDDKLDLRQDSAADRFITYFNVVGMTNAIYGLMRRSALARTALMGDGSFYAADINLMGELTLYGKIFEIPETLFLRRMHEEASSWNREDNTVQQLFWTGQKKKFVLPTLKKHIAFLKAIHQSPNSMQEKMRMHAHTMRRLIWMRKQVWEETLQFLNFG